MLLAVRWGQTKKIYDCLWKINRIFDIIPMNLFVFFSLMVRRLFFEIFARCHCQILLKLPLGFRCTGTFPVPRIDLIHLNIQT